MKEFKFVIDGESFEVSIRKENNDRAAVTVNGKSYVVEIGRGGAPASSQQNIQRPAAPPPVAPPPPPPPPPPVAAAPPPAASKSAGGPKTIKSPLPGNIFKVPVQIGQPVKRGETLVIIESMKMENDIMTDRDGTVKAIHVQPGQSVLQGDALVDLE